MNQYSIQDEDLPEFVVPKFHKIFAWAIAFSIIAIGAGISINEQNGDWLSRAGAVVVVLAMCFEASGIIEKYNNNIINIIREPAFDLVLSDVKRGPHMYGLSGNETEDQLNQIAAKETKNRLRIAKEKARHTTRTDLTKLEFQIAALGTVLWGFADLLNKVTDVC